MCHKILFSQIKASKRGSENLPAILEPELENEKADTEDSNDSMRSRFIPKMKDKKEAKKIKTVALGGDCKTKVSSNSDNNHHDVNRMRIIKQLRGVTNNSHVAEDHSKLTGVISKLQEVSDESQNLDIKEPLKGENCSVHFKEMISEERKEMNNKTANSKGTKNKHVTFKEIESERLQKVDEEENPTDLSDVTIVRGKVATLATRQRQRQRRMTFVAKTEFMANLNSVSHLTDQKILDIISQQTRKEDSQISENLPMRPSPQVPNRASPWKLSTVLGAICKPSKVDLFEGKTSFAQKREQIIAEQNIKDPLLKQICQTPVCLPPVSDGSVFQPLDRNWTVEDVVLPEHKTEPLTQDEWNQLRYCLYLRGRPIKNTTYQREK